MNPRIFISTERYTLRLAHPEDIRSIHLAITMSLPDLARWMPRALKGQTQRQTRDYIYTQMALFVQDENYLFAIFDKETQAFCGMAELSPRIPQIPSYELGFWIRSDLHGRGIASEVVKNLTAYAFDKLKANRVFMRCELDNRGSQRVAENCGFTKEAHLRNDTLGVDHKPVDTLIYGVIPKNC